MADVEKAVATQLANIERKTGKTLAQLHAALAEIAPHQEGK